MKKLLLTGSAIALFLLANTAMAQTIFWYAPAPAYYPDSPYVTYVYPDGSPIYYNYPQGPYRYQDGVE
jgi:hypothetical protein